MKPIATWGISALLSLNFAIGLQAQILTPNGGLDGSSGNQNVAIGFNGQPAEKLVVEDFGNSPGVLHLVASQLLLPPQGLGVGPDHAFKITHNTNDPTFGPGQTVSFTIEPNGKTFMGTALPGSGSMLSVHGPGGIGVYRNNLNNFIDLKHGSGLVPELSWRSTSGHNFVFRDGGTGNGVLYLSPDGKVGVGTEAFADNHKLYVAGSVYITDNGPEVHSLWVEGSILTEELTVMAKDDWPDYVFEPSYALMPLNEVGTFIKTHGRLPKMPSADQVAEEGIAVGETQRLLTEKVEELTLYLLEMSSRLRSMTEQYDAMIKQYDAVNEEMEVLREEITTLKGEK